MLNHIDDYFDRMPEPDKSCLLYLRQFILEMDSGISERWHYNTPFYHYGGKWMLYIPYNAKTRDLYLGFVHGYKLKHPALKSEGRKQIRIYRIDATKDIKIKELKTILKEAMQYIKTAKSPTR